MNVNKLAEVLTKHQPIVTPDGVGCNWTSCDFTVSADDWGDWQEMFAHHQAEATVGKEQP